MTFYHSNSWHVHEDVFSHLEIDDPRYRISASGSSSMSTSSSNAEEHESISDTQPLRDFNGRKKKTNNQRVQGKYHHVPHREKPPQVVAKRNARERRRVQAVNTAFVRLRKAVPFDNNRGKRISKVKTLQYAIDYIQKLQDLLNEFGEYQNIQYGYDFYNSTNNPGVSEYSMDCPEEFNMNY